MVTRTKGEGQGQRQNYGWGKVDSLDGELLSIYRGLQGLGRPMNVGRKAHGSTSNLIFVARNKLLRDRRLRQELAAVTLLSPLRIGS